MYNWSMSLLLVTTTGTSPPFDTTDAISFKKSLQKITNISRNKNNEKTYDVQNMGVDVEESIRNVGSGAALSLERESERVMFNLDVRSCLTNLLS